MSYMVSVIIPVYNSQLFLTCCIESILNQTYNNFELILIDDGSTDKSGLICDSYAEKDNRIKVIHQCNSGAAAARNQGILNASGKYLLFCDSDDVVAPMWIEHMIHCTDEGILPISSYCTEYDHLGRRKKLTGIIHEERVEQSQYYFFNKVGIAGFVWNALYSRKIVIDNHIFFRVQPNKGDYNEDLIFALSYVKRIKKLVYTGYADYLYNVHDTSISHSYQRYYFDKYAEKYILWERFVEKAFPLNEGGYQKELATEFFYHVLIALQMEINQAKSFFSKDCYSHFYTIIHSSVVRKCIAVADTSRENKMVVFAVKYKCSGLLWIFMKLVKLKKMWRK